MLTDNKGLLLVRSIVIGSDGNNNNNNNMGMFFAKM
jgi:hypothetical protein